MHGEPKRENEKQRTKEVWRGNASPTQEREKRNRLNAKTRKERDARKGRRKLKVGRRIGAGKIRGSESM